MSWKIKQYIITNLKVIIRKLEFSGYCAEYYDWVKFYNPKDDKFKYLTSKQGQFANFLLENKDIVGNIGNG